MALAGGLTGDSWAAKVLRICEKLGHNWRADLPSGALSQQQAREAAKRLAAQPLPTDVLLPGLYSRLLSDWRAERLEVDPRLYPTGATKPGVKMCRYKRWMGLQYDTGGLSVRLEHLKADIPRRYHVALMRFRLGCWDIEVNRPGGRSRADRTCRICLRQGLRCVEDEQHVLLECQAYQELREVTGLPQQSSMHEIMTNFDTDKLARLLHGIEAKRRLTLAR